MGPKRPRAPGTPHLRIRRVAALALAVALLVLPATSGARVLRAEENAPQAFTDAVLARLALIQHGTASEGVPQTFPQLQTAVQSAATCCGLDSLPFVVDPETGWAWSAEKLLQQASGSTTWLGETASVDARKAQIAAVLGLMEWRFAAHATDRGQLEKKAEGSFSNGCSINDARPELVQKWEELTATLDGQSATYIGNSGIEAKAYWFEVPGLARVHRTRDFMMAPLPTSTGQRPLPGFAVDGAALVVATSMSDGPGQGVGMGDVTVSGLGPVAAGWTPTPADWDAAGVSFGTLPPPAPDQSVSAPNFLEIPPEFLLADGGSEQPVFHSNVSWRMTGQEPPPQYLTGGECFYGDGGAGAAWITGTRFHFQLPGSGIASAGAVIYHQSLPPLGEAPGTADLVVTKTGPAKAQVGKDFTYELVVKNRGPNRAGEVVVTDVWDPALAGLALVPNGCTFGTNLVCAIGSLAKGATKKLSVTLTGAGPGRLKNVVTVSSPDTDPLPKNNRAQATTELYGMELTGLEITQGIQDLKGTVPLIHDRRTFVRAHVRGRGGGGSFEATGKLQVFDPETGRKISELSPLNRVPGNKPGFIDVKENPARSLLNDSFLFEIPDSDMFLYRTLEVRFKAVDQPLACKATYHELQESCDATFSTIPEPNMEIVFVPVGWKATDGSEQWPSPARDIPQAVRLIRATLPVGASSLSWEMSETEYYWPFGAPDEQGLNMIKNRIRLLRILDGCIYPACNKYYFGVARYPNQNETDSLPAVLGAAEAHFGGGVAGIAYLKRDNPQEHALTHELTHLNLGTSHVQCKTTETLAPIDTNYPYANGLISDFPAGDPDAIFFGLNTHTSGLPLVVDPRDTGDLMSYCIDNWPSAYTWNRNYSAMKNWFGTRVPALAVDPGSESMIVTGTVGVAGVQIESLLATEFPPEPSVSGSYTLRVTDASGAELGSYPFEPVGYDNLDKTFVASIPAHPEAATIEVLQGEQVLAARTASPSSPVVGLASVPETLTEPVELTWTASDADGDDLTYHVQYSADGGATWATIGVGLEENTLTIDPNNLAQSALGALRVIANDGFNTTVATSTVPFTVPSHDPSVSILSPSDLGVVAPLQTLSFEGSALDVDDGPLDDAALSWSSDGDPFATGPLATTGSEALGPGTHEITLTATDSDGNSSSASVTITVFSSVGKMPTCKGAYVTLLSGSRSDVMFGTPEADAIVGGGGNDRFSAGAGNDSACGGDGDDRIAGGGGKDKLKGDAGNDVIDGGPGRDVCYGGPGRERFKSCEVKKP